MIRKFIKADLARLHDLIQTTIVYSYRNIYPDRAVQFFKNHHSENAILERSQNGVILLSQDNGSLVATGSLVANEILGVFVAPVRQGRGHGSAIMKELEEQARRNGFSEIVLDISLPSKSFYEKLHYQISDECIFDVGKGQILKYWKGYKKLSV